MSTKFCIFVSVTFALGCCAGCYQRGLTSVPGDADQAASSLAATEHDLGTESSTIEIAPPRPAPVYSRDVAPLLEQYCLQCHDSTSARGDVVLDVFSDRSPDKEQRPLLLRMAANLRSGNMPPDGKPHPDPDELEIINSWLDAALFDGANGPGRVAGRRHTTN
jgi:Planctomycete cytochrome C